MSARQLALEALKTFGGAYPHDAPNDCFATGPLTGDFVQDLIVCPGCVAENLAHKAIAALEVELAQAVDVANREVLLGAIARGWCSDKNRFKEMDSDLAVAIADEVAKVFTAPQEPAVNADLLAALNNQMAATYALLDWAVEVSDEYLDGETGLRAELANDLSKAREHSNQSRAAIAKAEKS